MLLYRRRAEGEALIIALNLGAEPVSITSSAIGFGNEILLSTFLDRQGESIEGMLDLRGNEGVIIGKSERSGRMTCVTGGIGIDVAALQQIIQPADAVPAISIAFEHQFVPAARRRPGCDPPISRLTSSLPASPGTPDANETSRGFSSRLCTNNTELLRQS